MEMVTSTLMMLLPDPVPDQEHPSDELETLDHLQLDRQLDLGYMTFWSIPQLTCREDQGSLRCEDQGCLRQEDQGGLRC